MFQPLSLWLPVTFIPIPVGLGHSIADQVMSSLIDMVWCLSSLYFFLFVTDFVEDQCGQWLCQPSPEQWAIRYGDGGFQSSGYLGVQAEASRCMAGTYLPAVWWGVSSVVLGPTVFRLVCGCFRLAFLFVLINHIVHGWRNGILDVCIIVHVYDCFIYVFVPNRFGAWHHGKWSRPHYQFNLKSYNNAYLLFYCDVRCIFRCFMWRLLEFREVRRL